MSTPPFLDLPKCARLVRWETARGAFAAHCAEPEGTPRGTALLVPGFTGSKEDFNGLLSPLTLRGWRVVALDPRGQNGTGGPDDEAAYRLPELARDVRAVAETLRAPRREGDAVHLVGHSLGGFVARAAVLGGANPDTGADGDAEADGLAARTARGWASVTLLSSGPAAVDQGEAARLRMLLEGLETLDLEGVWQVMQRMDAEARDSAPPVSETHAADPAPSEEPAARTPDAEISAFLHRRWLRNVPACLRAQADVLLGEPDRVAALARLPLATLVLSGEWDDAWPVPWQTDMAWRLGARHRVISGAGHSPNASHAGETADALSAFWRSVTPGDS